MASLEMGARLDIFIVVEDLVSIYIIDIVKGKVVFIYIGVKCAWAYVYIYKHYPSSKCLSLPYIQILLNNFPANSPTFPKTCNGRLLFPSTSL